MILNILRALFLVVLFSAAFLYAGESELLNQYRFQVLLGALGLGLIVVALDSFTPRKSLSAIGGLFFGLAVGMLFAYVFSLVIALVAEAYGWAGDVKLVNGVKILVGAICCYFSISFIMQTKDDFRFVIPYVEFTRQTRGARPFILDTSVIIDGRIADVAETRILESPIVIPRFVLLELQDVADSADKLKRMRGRRGLDVLHRLQTNAKVEIQIQDSRPALDHTEDVDQLLLVLAKDMNGRLVTNDYNLSKVAKLRGVDIININDLTNALKPVVLPGESLSIRIAKAGEEPGQGVGYLEDGTMVVVESAGDRVGQDVPVTVTSSLQTSAGKMIFGRNESAPQTTSAASRPRRR